MRWIAEEGKGEKDKMDAEGKNIPLYIFRLYKKTHFIFT